MYKLLCIFTGAALAFMMTFNGELSAAYGTFGSTVIIHIVGTVFAFLICLIKKEKIRLRTSAPLWAYLGGTVGVFQVLCNALCYGHIAVSSITALALLGKMLSSLLFDRFGLMGLKKQPIGMDTWISFFFGLIGMYIMIDNTGNAALFAIFIAIGVGVLNVLARTINARLSQETGPLCGSFINHLTGLPLSLILFLILGSGMASHAGLQVFDLSKLWMYLGGTIGVLTVLLGNITVPKVDAFNITVLSFVGQSFTSMLIDIILGNTGSSTSFAGGVVICFGILLGMLAKHYIHNKKSRI